MTFLGVTLLGVATLFGLDPTVDLEVLPTALLVGVVEGLLVAVFPDGLALVPTLVDVLGEVPAFLPVLVGAVLTVLDGTEETLDEDFCPLLDVLVLVLAGVLTRVPEFLAAPPLADAVVEVLGALAALEFLTEVPIVCLPLKVVGL